MPFLVLGVSVSAAIAAFVPPGFLPRVLPDRPALAVPVAAVAGAALPGCECGSVPIAGRLVLAGVAARGRADLPALGARDQPGRARLDGGRVPGPARGRRGARCSRACSPRPPSAWSGRGSAASTTCSTASRRRTATSGTRLAVFVDTAQHDLLHAGGFLIVGAATAATLQTVVPRSVLDTLAGSGLLAVLALAGLAVVMAICSEADAFVAASLTQFSMTSRLAFMVVGPMVDVKLIALQAGTFGGRSPPLRAADVRRRGRRRASSSGWWLL